jgi:hypothetical protein
MAHLSDRHRNALRRGRPRVDAMPGAATVALLISRIVLPKAPWLARANGASAHGMKRAAGATLEECQAAASVWNMRVKSQLS